MLSLLTLTSFSGCTTKPEIRYIDKPYEVKIPVKCIVPKTQCDFNRTSYTEVISSMLECIIKLKRNSEVCNGK